MSKNEEALGELTSELEVDGRSYRIVSLGALEGTGRLPVALRVLVENVIRRGGGSAESIAAARGIIRAGLAGAPGDEISFMPARVLYQDFTGVPVFVDFAAMRDAAAARGADPELVNPQIPCTLVIDHSVTADVVSCATAARDNARIEAERNAERFSFLKWSSESYDNVRIVPPGRGICHQLNIERFCDVVTSGSDPEGSEPWAFFDTLVGTDSHTTTANGVGVLGWGVGGIEAEAASLGQPIAMVVPPVVGLHLSGSLRPGSTAMDVALSCAELLRGVGVVGSIVEVFGEGVASLSVTQRATIANMTPEYGATATFFPPDEATLENLETFGRDEVTKDLARAYLEREGILGYEAQDVVYSRVVDLDLSLVEPSLAGPSRPQDRVSVSGLKERFRETLADHGRSVGETFELGSGTGSVTHGAIAIAAVTSCTTATDPAMMVACGLAARHAVEAGCKPPSYVKLVLAPGSHATTEMLSRAGLIEPLERLGFSVCGYGCMSCIGNSGPVFDEMMDIADDCELASVLSGNRNFEGRISPQVAQNYLCAPALVVAYALAGTVDVDLSSEPVCMGEGGPVMLSDILPSDAEVAEALSRIDVAGAYRSGSTGLFEGDEAWASIDVEPGSLYAWDPASSYVRRPPFLEAPAPGAEVEIRGARALALLGDFVTTDHISPAGAISPDSPAADYLRERGISQRDFNTYGSRRGNHEIMMRGTFANVRLENALAGGRRGGWTTDPVSGEIATIFAASESARDAGIPLVVIAGKMYGSGSSRDWAAKGPALLGVRAVIAESFERIHRSNLIGMGILPLELPEGATASSLGIAGDETFDVSPVRLGAGAGVRPTATVTATRPDGSSFAFDVVARVDTPTEALYIAHGGILPYVLDRLIG